MTGTAPHLPWLRSFEACARRLNFTLAGQEIGLTQAAVSQQIASLETSLGVSLFKRGRRGVELTVEGAAYLPHVQAAFATLSHSTQALFGESGAQAVSLITPASFGLLWLAPRLAALTATHPDLRLTLSTMQSPADYTAANADLEIRFGLGEWPGRTAYRITAERLTPICAPTLIAGDHAGRDWRDLPLLAVRGARELWSDWFLMAGQRQAARPTLTFDTFAIALEAAKAGAGVLLGSRPLIDADLARNQVARLSELELQSPNGHFLCLRAGEPPTSARQALLDWFLREASGAATLVPVQAGRATALASRPRAAER